MTGRKRHLLVDTQGSILATVVHPADIQDREGAYLVLEQAEAQTTRVQQLWADAAYRGAFARWVTAGVGLDHRDRTTPSGHGRLRGAAPGAGSWNGPSAGWAAAAG